MVSNGTWPDLALTAAQVKALLLTGGESVKRCFDAVKDYLTNDDTNNGWRGSLNLEYEDMEENEFAVGGLASPVRLDGGA